MKNYEIWIPTSKAELRDRWGSALAHFAMSEAGQYCAANNITCSVTDEREPRIQIFGQTFYYKVVLSDLEDEHAIWLKLKGVLICRFGMKSTLQFPQDEWSKIQFLPVPTKMGYHFVPKPKSPSSK